jgi:hypothetical protein
MSPKPAASSYPVVPLIWPARYNPRHTFGFERRPQLRRIDEVVFHGISRAHHLRVFESLDRAHHRKLNVRREGSRKPVHVEQRRVEALGLQEELMSFAICEPHHLVLERRTVPGSASGDRSGEQRRPVEMPRHEVVHEFVGVGDMAGDLRQRNAFGQLREEDRRLITGLLLETT